jgi:phospholipid-binding lipoprotein MlaA
VRLWRAAALLAAVVLAAAASGCASTADGDPRDPLEPLNRAVYGINQGVDDVLAKPVATAYRDYVPEPLRVYVRNFFSNIGDLLIGFNNIIQGKPDDGLQDWARFAFNTIFGVFGINDIASDIGFEKHNEDFGQTLGRWGFGDGPYLVIPFLGSSDLRDGIGTIADIYADPLADVRPIRLRTTAYALRFTSLRADLLDASRILEEAALDKYVFQRDAYLQRRRNLVYDGRPPREEPPPEDEEKDAPEPKKGAAAPVNSTLASNVQGNNDPFQSGFPHANNY